MGHVNGTYEVDTWIKKPVFHRTDRAIEPFIRPLYHFGLSGLEGAGEEGAPVEQAGGVGDTSIEGVEEDKVRIPNIPYDPGRPTRKELFEHLPLHWPFRSWCRHCVCGRGVSSPHRSRTAEERDFGRGRIPTLSMDRCFLGTLSNEEPAREHPLLVIYDNESEAIFAIAAASRSTKESIVEFVKKVLHELGYSELKVVINCDGARELQ